MKHSMNVLRSVCAWVTLILVTTSVRPTGVIADTESRSAAVQGQIGGSTAGTGKPFNGMLTFRDAIERGLAYNLTSVGLRHAVEQARGQQRIARSVLLPNITGDVSTSEQVVNLTALGVRFGPFPGFSVPDISGPFNVVDLRARLTQTVVDLRGLNTYRAAQENLRASELSLEDSRDLIVQAVGGAYLEAVATRAKIAATRAQLDTANAIHQRAVQQQGAGLATPVDVNRARVQTLSEQHRLAALEADLAKRKINLARMIGLPPSDRYDLAEDVPFSPAPGLTVDAALKLSTERRADLQAAEAQLRAAERSLAAARAERLPSVAVTADYGTSRASTKPTYRTYTVAGVVRVPIWQGGRAAGDIERATAALSQRRAEVDDLRAQIEGDVRKAYVDLDAAASQVEVARASLQLSNETLGLTRQRFEAGLSDNVSVVQAQQAVALAEADYINSVFAHNLAKLGLARSIGSASEDLAQYLQIP